MASAESQAVEAALEAWRDCERERYELPHGPERDAKSARCAELEAAYEDAVEALSPEAGERRGEK